MMSLRDIAVEDSEQIPRVLEDLTSGIRDAVLGGGALACSAPGPRRISCILRTAPLPLQLLDIRMVEIRQRWQVNAAEHLAARMSVCASAGELRPMSCAGGGAGAGRGCHACGWWR